MCTSCALPAEAPQKMSTMASTSLSVSGRESCSLYGCSDSITWGGLHPTLDFCLHPPTRLHILGPQCDCQCTATVRTVAQPHRALSLDRHTGSCDLPEEGTYGSNDVAVKSRRLSGHLGGDCRGGCSPFPASRCCAFLTSRRWVATPPSCSSCSEADVTMIGMPPPHRALSVSAAAPPCQAKTTG